MNKLLFVFGTRPEALKLAPLILAAKKDRRFSVEVCFTGQHREMAFQVLDLFRLKADYDLNVMKPNQSLSLLTERLISKLDPVMKKSKPNVVIVQGDTTSAFVGALSSYYHKVPVAHVEAGLRSFDKYQPFPEELNRAFAGRIADWHFAPTAGAAKNLLDENTDRKKVYITGNTVVDALKTVYGRLNLKNAVLAGEILKRKNRIILATTHRRENFGKPLEEICSAFSELTRRHSDIEILFLVHKNPKVQKTVYRMLSRNRRIHLIPPVDYLEFLTMMKFSYLIISDSGGVQEEAPTFHKPVLVLRNVTERPEGVKIGAAKLVGSDFKKITSEASKLLSNKKAYLRMSSRKNPYGDGRTSRRILNILNRCLSKKNAR
ncbi:MAG TPA: UDP-N-acetylglucosamine 2-epimerase (non-hydrolyzing) [Candidatus Omnitrophica bacterium]|nr:UDP-N-acetylglucosamine 2-epimerase (non-hydrolyzing) [Candidatus Omnitrophota bacterium]